MIRNMDLAPRVVDLIASLPEGYRTSMALVVEELFKRKGVKAEWIRRDEDRFLIDSKKGNPIVSEDQLWGLETIVAYLAARRGVDLDKSEFNGMDVGAPYNIPFVIKHDVDSLLNPQPLHIAAIRMPARYDYIVFTDIDQPKDEEPDEAPVVVLNKKTHNSPVTFAQCQKAFPVCLPDNRYLLGIYINDELVEVAASCEGEFAEYEGCGLDLFVPWLFMISKQHIDDATLLRMASE